MDKDLDLTNLKAEDLEALKARINEEKMRREPKKSRIYCHRDKDSNWELADELELTEEQTLNFRYTGCEISIDIEIDHTGQAWATHFENQPLPEKVKI